LEQIRRRMIIFVIMANDMRDVLLEWRVERIGGIGSRYIHVEIKHGVLSMPVQPRQVQSR
jgi:hypothetical protein